MLSVIPKNLLTIRLIKAGLGGLLVFKGYIGLLNLGFKLIEDFALFTSSWKIVFAY
jgi:hypothetical protein